MQEEAKEVVLQGIGVASGVVSGKALVWNPGEVQFENSRLADHEVEEEIGRFEAALKQTAEQLRKIQEQLSSALGTREASVLDAHIMVTDDRAFIGEVIREVRSSRENVESVLSRVSEKYVDVLSRVDDDYLRERASDVRDVTQRMLQNLTGAAAKSLSLLKVPCIVISHDLSPSDTAGINKKVVKGFATNLGSETSHTAIMARALELPAVVGLHDVTEKISTGDSILIDGGQGILVINPTPERLEAYGRKASEQRAIRKELAMLRDLPAQTRDGVVIRLSGNLELPDEVPLVHTHGVKGVGLFRSEFLFANRSRLPDEEEQYRSYVEVARSVAPHPVVIRTLDVGGDKINPMAASSKEANPFLGFRAIRFCLGHPEIFKVQLRAILRASAEPNVRIMFPMITRASEIVQAKAMMKECAHELEAEGIEYNPDLQVGIMIEVPSAALIADKLAPYVDFFSIGTNDLIQYTMAVDRVNENVAHLYQPTHFSILKLISLVVDAGKAHGVPVCICGEMAGNPILVPLLIGLGVSELSVIPTLAPMVKDVIRSIGFDQTRNLVHRAMESEMAEEAYELCRNLIAETAPEILELLG